MALTQKNRLLGLKTPLGEDVLLLTAFHGREEMARLFQFELDLISDDDPIAAADIVGKNVTFSILQSDGTPRCFNGFVSQFVVGDEEGGRCNYQATVVPWLWFLTQTADCRIFQNKTVVEIIEQIFQDLGFSDYETAEVRGSHKQWEYCVQYRETDFNFVSRLMEQEGIFYYFRHEDGKHTLVMADQTGAYKDCPEKEVDYPAYLGEDAITDHITGWEHRYEFHSGKCAQTDYNFKTPSTSLMTDVGSVVQVSGIDKYEVYDFPGEYASKSEGDAEVRLRMEEVEVEHDVANGASLCKTFTPGGKFKITGARAGADENKIFAITSISHSATEPMAYETGAAAELDYGNTFTCIPESIVFRPARITPKPLVSGIQTAVVTGPAGEEIYCDEHGRVKVQFHWDREGKKDENTSCWARVSQVHAGKGWGGIDIPRIGEEVLLDFLEGDPDRPVITGRVYHAENMPPYGLPAGKNISGIKTNSTKGGGGYNEYVLDDTKSNELIREHGQFDKDSTIEHDLREHVLNDRSRDVTNIETITVGVDRTKSVGSNETLNVGSNRTRSVGQNEMVTVALTRTHTVGVNEAITVGVAQEITVGAARAITVGASQVVNVGANLSETIGGSRSESVGGSRSSSVGKDDSLSVGKKLSIDAGDQITIKTGKASITMKKDGTISIEGKDITIKGSGKINAKASKDMILKGKKILQN